MSDDHSTNRNKKSQNNTFLEDVVVNDIKNNELHPEDNHIEHDLDIKHENITDDIMGKDSTDNSSVLVIILQCETRTGDPNIKNLKWIFSDPYFTVQVLYVEPPKNIPVPNVIKEEEYCENYIMRKAMIYAEEGPYYDKVPQYFWTKLPVIIIKDSSISNVTPTTQRDIDNHTPGMKDRIKLALEVADKADLYFLCKWGDSCHQHSDVEGMKPTSKGSNLKWTVRPTATQAIMYKPSSRDYIKESLVKTNTSLSSLLNNNISNKKLLATAFVPNIIDFDIEFASSNEHYLKLNECCNSTTATEPSNAAPVIWAVIIIILLVLIAWFVLQFL
jgi:hypothetical protein